MTRATTTDKRQAPRAADLSDAELAEIRNALRELRFGSVHIVVQDGVIVQIERTEKHRLRRSDRNS